MKNKSIYAGLRERFLALLIGLDGHRAGLWKGIVRNALRLVDGLPAFSILGIILIQRSRERARFGDRIAGTRVIRVPYQSP